MVCSACSACDVALFGIFQIHSVGGICIPYCPAYDAGECRALLIALLHPTRGEIGVALTWPWGGGLAVEERITKKRTKNKAKTTKPDSEWKRL
ncbi:hypothetical protein Tco_0777219 [Tanacetum coccineum]